MPLLDTSCTVVLMHCFGHQHISSTPYTMLMAFHYSTISNFLSQSSDKAPIFYRSPTIRLSFHSLAIFFHFLSLEQCFCYVLVHILIYSALMMCRCTLLSFAAFLFLIALFQQYLFNTSVLLHSNKCFPF